MRGFSFRLRLCGFFWKFSEKKMGSLRMDIKIFSVSEIY